MDPLTHTLVGANLAATRLGRAGRLAPAALVIGANLPDIDVLSYAWGSDAALGFRRGWTHGIPALVVLPLLLALLLLGWDRLVASRRSPAPPRARFAPLLALSAGATLTHPALDWLNNYGMRWGMPIHGAWSYGDSVFIADPWLWVALGAGWLLGRRRSGPLVVGWGLVTAVALGAAAQRLPSALPALAIVAVGLLWLLLRPALGPEGAERAAWAGLSVAAVWIVGLVLLHGATEARVLASLEERLPPAVQRWMVGPMPMDPTTWEVVAETSLGIRHGRFRWLPTPRLELESGALPPASRHPRWDEVRRSPALRGFLAWARFPALLDDPAGRKDRLWLVDVRYARSPVGGFGGAPVDLEPTAAEVSAPPRRRVLRVLFVVTEGVRADREALRGRFPSVRVRDDVRLVVDGKYVTSVGGAMSYEPALWLTERLFGAKNALATAEGLVWPWDVATVPTLVVR